MTAKIQPFWWFLKPALALIDLIKNGDFETGSLTYWDYYMAYVDLAYAHSGGYGCRLGDYGWIQQNLTEPCKVSDLVEFTFWHRGWTSYSTVECYFSDGTYYSVNCPQDFDWTQSDVKYILITAGYGSKTLTKIKFIFLFAGSMSCLDDIKVTMWGYP